MFRYFVKRILLMIPVLCGVILLVFLIMELSPVDPAEVMLGDGATPESIAKLRTEFGLDDPLLVRYGRYLLGLIQGDLGTSYKSKLNVAEEVIGRLPTTFLLAVGAMLWAMVIGIPLGIISARNQNKLIDNISMVVALIGNAMPAFWMGLLLVMLFSLNLRWLPSSGINTTDGIVPFLKSIILPTFTLGLVAMCSITRAMRSSMLDVINQDYIDTARSKGITEWWVTMRHMFKNAMVVFLTFAGLQFGRLLGGAVMVEFIFAWPGLGRLMVDSISSRDIPLVVGAVVVLSICFSLVNLLVDFLYAYVDPAIKTQYLSEGKRKRKISNEEPQANLLSVK